MAAVTAATVGGLALGAYQANRSSQSAKDAAKLQAASASEAAAGVDQRFQDMRTDLSPYRQAGEQALPALTDFTMDPNAQHDFLQNNPMFQASMNVSDRATAANLARHGRIGTGDQSLQLQEIYLMNAAPLIQQREQSLLNLAQIGGNAAAQTGSAGMNAANISGDLITGGANATAAGVMANNANNAQLARDAMTAATQITGALTSK